MGRIAEDLSGKIFGGWQVLSRVTPVCTHHSGVQWLCRCKCGVEKPVYGSHLRLGKSLSCRRCSEHKHKGRICSRIWARVRNSAKKRNLPIDFGGDQEGKLFLYDLLHKKQNCCCALTGWPITIADTIAEDMAGESTASLDRIDSTKGYTKENVQWVHKLVNRAKWNLEESQFLILCQAVIQHHQATFFGGI